MKNLRKPIRGLDFFNIRVLGVVKQSIALEKSHFEFLFGPHPSEDSFRKCLHRPLGIKFWQNQTEMEIEKTKRDDERDEGRPFLSFKKKENRDQRSQRQIKEGPEFCGWIGYQPGK